VHDPAAHARTALEQVCARGDLDRAREHYATDFLDPSTPLEVRCHEGIARSVAVYRALFSVCAPGRRALGGIAEVVARKQG
jgi:hypothetical protein